MSKKTTCNIVMDVPSAVTAWAYVVKVGGSLSAKLYTDVAAFAEGVPADLPASDYGRLRSKLKAWLTDDVNHDAAKAMLNKATYDRMVRHCPNVLIALITGKATGKLTASAEAGLIEMEKANAAFEKANKGKAIPEYQSSKRREGAKKAAKARATAKKVEAAKAEKAAATEKEQGVKRAASLHALQEQAKVILADPKATKATYAKLLAQFVSI